MYIGVKMPWSPLASSAHAARSSIWCVAHVPCGAHRSFSSSHVKRSVRYAARRAAERYNHVREASWVTL
jgi:hypothetical protein